MFVELVVLIEFIIVFFFSVTKPDSVRKLVEHLDERRWRTLDYFRVLDKKHRLVLNKETIKDDLLV